MKKLFLITMLFAISNTSVAQAESDSASKNSVYIALCEVKLSPSLTRKSAEGGVAYVLEIKECGNLNSKLLVTGRLSIDEARMIEQRLAKVLPCLLHDCGADVLEINVWGEPDIATSLNTGRIEMRWIGYGRISNYGKVYTLIIDGGGRRFNLRMQIGGREPYSTLLELMP